MTRCAQKKTDVKTASIEKVKLALSNTTRSRDSAKVQENWRGYLVINAGCANVQRGESDHEKERNS